MSLSNLGVSIEALCVEAIEEIDSMYTEVVLAELKTAIEEYTTHLPRKPDSHKFKKKAPGAWLYRMCAVRFYS